MAYYFGEFVFILGLIVVILCIIVGGFIFLTVFIEFLTGIDIFKPLEKLLKKIVKSIKNFFEKIKKRKFINKRKKEIRKSVRKTDNIKIEVLKYEYSEYVNIVNNIINNTFNSKIPISELYLLKLHENFKKINPDIHSIEGLACLYNSVIETPVIYESNYNVVFINELLSYDIPSKYLYYNSNKIDIFGKEKILQKCLDDCMKKKQRDIYKVAYFIIKSI